MIQVHRSFHHKRRKMQDRNLDNAWLRMLSTLLSKSVALYAADTGHIGKKLS